MSVLNKAAGLPQYIGLCLPNECVDYVLTPEFAAKTQAYFNEKYKEAKSKEGKNTTLEPFQKMKFINPVADAPKVWERLMAVWMVELCSVGAVAGNDCSRDHCLRGIFCLDQ